MSQFVVHGHGHLGGTQHQKAVSRVFSILLKNVKYRVLAKEMPLKAMRQGYPYVADIYVEQPDLRQFIVEIDGKIGHNYRKDQERDRECKKHGITVIRFNTKDIVSRKPLTDAQIMEEIQWVIEKAKC